MRNLIALLFALLSVGFIYGQTGPGGVGNASNIEAWMDASRLSLINNDPVSTWTDFSGNANNATQALSARQPVFLTNQLNGLPAIDFDGTDDHLDFSSNISATATTIFTVSKNDVTTTKATFSTQNHSIFTEFASATAIYFSPTTRYKVSKTNFQFSVFSMQTEANTTSGSIFLTNENFSNTFTRVNFANRPTSAIGTRYSGATPGLFNDGQIAEIIIFNEEINSAKRKIVSNHLAAKYSLTPEQNLYSFGSTHGNQLIGVGQEADGSHTIARGLDSLQIENPSSLANGDYILVGNDGAGYATSLIVPADAIQRWEQVWRADITGTPGSIDLTFFLGSNDFATDPNDYVVLIENIDGDFSNGGTSQQETGRVYDALNNTVSFTGISLIDGAYFTLAEKDVTAPPPPTSFIDFGPGGVGNTGNIAAWMDANRLSFNNNDPVDSWLDVSGNDNHAEQVTAANQPRFLTNQLNGLPAIDFDGVNDHLDFLTNISVAATTIFTVSKNDATTTKATFSTQNHSIFTEFASATAIYFSPTTRYKVSKTNFQFSVFSMQTEANTTSGSIFLNNENSSNTFTRVNFANRPTSAIGTRYSGATPGLFNDGQIAEIIVFNEEINSAKRKIVSNHLAAKYNLTPEQNLYAFASTHNTEVFGIGQEADGSHLEARGRDSLLINNASALGNGDYILIGNDNADFTVSSDAIPSVIERWNRTWRADVTGTPGTIDVQFFLGSNGFAATSDYVVVIEEADGDFTNGGTRIHETGRSFDAGTLSICFTGFDLADGATFTLAEKSTTNISSIANGNWENTATWDCTCIPGEINNVTIDHNVTINNNESVNDIRLNAGSIIFGNSDSLFIYGDFDNQVTNAPLMAGTIVVANTSATQSFTGSGTASIEMDNLQVNALGLTVSSGDWTILNNIQVSAGSITANGTSNVVFASSAAQTSQILPSVSGAFTGTNFTVERFISARNSNYSNMAAPISNATANDLDGELVLSGIGGNNGNALATGGGTFNSMWFFNSPTDLHVAITSTTTALPSGRGFEVFLDTVPNFNATTVTYEGTPFSGPLSSTIIADQGWNLIGNPYHSFIDVGALDKGSIPDDYWIYNSSTGSYDFVTGASNTPIAPGQGFWLDKSTSGNQFINFDENDKVDNTSSAFVRKKKDSKFKLTLSSTENNYSHQMAVIFDYNATAKLDELDARYLPSPLKEAPAIYSQATNSDKDLIVNSLDAFEESHIIPIDIYAGVDGAYSIDAENLTELYDSYSCVYLKDKVNNQSVDLSVETSYQFESTKGSSKRFELIVSNSYVECEKLIEDGSFIQELDHNLELRNAYGDWYLDYTLDDKQQQVEIRILNMNGQEVREAVSFGASNAGTYRLQNLQELNGIYLIQIRTKDGFLNKTVKL